MCTHRKLSQIILCIAVAACGSGDGSLLVAGKGESPDWSERRARMNITAVDSTTGVRVELTAAELVQSGLQSDCETQLAESDDGTVLECEFLNSDVLAIGATRSCRKVACDSQLRLCAAHKLMELADVPQFDRAVGPYLIGPQDRSTQAGLHELAVQIARENILTPLARSLRPPM